MRVRVLVALYVAGGCGRVGYDAARDGGAPDARADVDAAGALDAANVDAASGGPDAAEMDASLTRETWTFGEIPGATVAGVTADTLLCSGSSGEDLNYGASERIEGGFGCTGLVRFDLTALPAGAIVVEAAIEVWPQLVPSVQGQVDVHRVLEAWDEGTEQGDPGWANYLERQPGVAWTRTGARPPDSSDATVLHSFHPGVFEAQRIPLPVPVVQDWVDTPGTNHGISLFGSDAYGFPDSEHPHFVSSENTQAAQRPILIVTFDY